MKRLKSQNRFVALCVAPATILFLIFMVYPTLVVFKMSLFERGAYSPKETFVGFDNFKVLMTDSRFIRSAQNTIFLVVIVTILTFASALFFASCLTREKLKGNNFFRIIFYIPNILSIVVIAGVFSAIYDNKNGLLNSVLSLFTAEKVTILWKSEGNVILSLVIAMVL